MNTIYAIQPTITTLLIFMLIPFLYFFFHYRYWYNFNTLQRADVLLKMLSLVLGAIVIVIIAKKWSAFSKSELQLAAMHLIPLLAMFLTVEQQKFIMQQVARYASGVNSHQQGQPDPANYNPVPVNKAIEQLSWDDLIISNELKTELHSVAQLLRNPEESQKYGIDLPKGILLMGPPGTGKTTIAKVMANEAGMNFFVLSMDEIVSKWVGESEKNLTKLFMAATKHAPAIIFIDEVDSIGRGRSNSGEQWADNLLNHLLQLIDGVIKTKGLYIIAATNRADLVDDALKRAGRLNKVIEIPLPDYNARGLLFQHFLRKLPLAENINLEVLAKLTQGKSGADIKAICQQAGLNAFKRESGNKRKEYKVTIQDIELALREFLSQ